MTFFRREAGNVWASPAYIVAFYDRHPLTPAGKVPCCELAALARAQDDQFELLDIRSFACDHGETSYPRHPAHRGDILGEVL